MKGSGSLCTCYGMANNNACWAVDFINLSIKIIVDDVSSCCNKYGLNSADILYMGDDIPDIPVMKLVGTPTCPADAAVEVKDLAKYISLYNGGYGCARDVIEQVLKAQNKWLINNSSYSW